MSSEQQVREVAGQPIATEAFAYRTIRIYEKGYVRIGMLGTFRAPLERLISIAAAADLDAKDGFVYLTIVTDLKTHELRERPLTSGALRAAMALDAAGQDALDSSPCR